jgi:N utilization substance protein B
MAAIDREIAGMDDNPDAQNLKPFSLGLDDKQKQFAFSLAVKIEDNKETLNSLIKPVLHNWDISRISRIDRIILWIALTEMLYMFDIPYSVSMNEAIELAKKYSSEKSSSFINGILDCLCQTMKRNEETL